MKIILYDILRIYMILIVKKLLLCVFLIRIEDYIIKMEGILDYFHNLFYLFYLVMGKKFIFSS
jgi:hypothetical protein